MNNALDPLSENNTNKMLGPGDRTQVLMLASSARLPAVLRCLFVHIIETNNIIKSSNIFRKMRENSNGRVTRCHASFFFLETVVLENKAFTYIRLL